METAEAVERIEKKNNEMMARLQTAVQKTKEACDRLDQKTRSAAKVADQSIQEHPYTALSIAFGIGVLVGLLASRGRG